MSGSTPQAEDPSGPSLSPGPDTPPGLGDGVDDGSGVQPDAGEGLATEPGRVAVPDNGTEHGPDTAPGQQTGPAAGLRTVGPEIAPGPGTAPGYGLRPDPGAEGYGTVPGFDTRPGPGPAPDYGSQPGYAPQPGYATQPGYAPPPGYPTQPGHSPPSGYAPQPGYAPPPGSGYGPPGPGGTYPAPPARRRRGIWLGIIAGFMVLVAVIAGISVYLLNKPQKWVLTAPHTLVGMSPDISPTDQLGFNALIAKFKSDLTSLPHYGRLNVNRQWDLPAEPKALGRVHRLQRHVQRAGRAKDESRPDGHDGESRPARRYGRVRHGWHQYVVSVVHRHHGRHRDRDSHQPGRPARKSARTRIA